MSSAYKKQQQKKLVDDNDNDNTDNDDEKDKKHRRRGDWTLGWIFCCFLPLFILGILGAIAFGFSIFNYTKCCQNITNVAVSNITNVTNVTTIDLVSIKGALFATDDTEQSNDGCGTGFTTICFNNILLNTDNWVYNSTNCSFQVNDTGIWQFEFTIFTDQSFFATTLSFVLASVQIGGTGPFVQISGSSAANGNTQPTPIFPVSSVFTYPVTADDVIIFQYGFWASGDQGNAIQPWDFNFFGLCTLGVDEPISARVNMIQIQ
jgi:hypothetical protein